MAVKKKIIIIINERGRFACQAYMVALSDIIAIIVIQGS